MNRYLISHPSINKESYIDTNHVRSVFFSLDADPIVLNNPFENLLSYAHITEDDIGVVVLNPYAHFVVSFKYIFDESYINKYATVLYRTHTFKYDKVIHGPALLFGSIDPLTLSRENIHYSVPYELLEQSSNLLFY